MLDGSAILQRYDEDGVEVYAVVDHKQRLTISMWSRQPEDLLKFVYRGHGNWARM